jgi:hypothetical protein
VPEVTLANSDDAMSPRKVVELLEVRPVRARYSRRGQHQRGLTFHYSLAAEKSYGFPKERFTKPPQDI